MFQFPERAFAFKSAALENEADFKALPKPRLPVFRAAYLFGKTLARLNCFLPKTLFSKFI